MRNLNKISSSTDIIGYAEKLYSFALRGFFIRLEHPLADLPPLLHDVQLAMDGRGNAATEEVEVTGAG